MYKNSRIPRFLAALAVLLPGAFTCILTGSGDSGFDIRAKNPGSTNQKCTATCTVKKKDGTSKSWTYTRTVTGKTPDRHIWLGGETGVAGAPLSDPKISDISCPAN